MRRPAGRGFRRQADAAGLRAAGRVGRLDGSGEPAYRRGKDRRVAGTAAAGVGSRARPVSGKFEHSGGKADFEWLADADSRLGPILEAVIDGRYFWVPLENIHQIVLEKPKDLRDVVWVPAEFMWRNGGTAVGLIPSRYPGSESSTGIGAGDVPATHGSRSWLRPVRRHGQRIDCHRRRRITRCWKSGESPSG